LELQLVVVSEIPNDKEELEAYCQTGERQKKVQANVLSVQLPKKRDKRTNNDLQSIT
jgi:hypothetical protein